LGGIIVLFIYISSLASNEKFSLFLSDIYLQIIFLIIAIIFRRIFLRGENLIKKKIELSKIIYKIYSENIIEITIFTILYLIITLIVVVKITSIFSGPIRSKI
jgi:NADH-ubiquinone oxidoreductase chain 6